MAKIPANKNGLPFGEFIHTGAFPARVAGRSNAQLTFAEVYGFAQEMGDVYTKQCRVISEADFREMVKQQGLNPDKIYCSALQKWQAEQN